MFPESVEQTDFIEKLLTQFFLFCAGVHAVDTNVEAKTVVVEADDSVSAQLMLEKLLKVSGH